MPFISGFYQQEVNPRSKKTSRVSLSLNALLRKTYGMSQVQTFMTNHLLLHGFDTFFTGLKFDRVITLMEINPDSKRFDLHNVATTWLKVMMDRLITKKDKQLCECLPDDGQKYVVGHVEVFNYDLPPCTMRFTIYNLDKDENPDTNLLQGLIG